MTTEPWEQRCVEETVKRLKLNDHAPLAEERRKVWQKVDGLIEGFQKAKTRCAVRNNSAAKEKFKAVRDGIREMTNPTAESSTVARWCLLLRNNPQLSRLVG